MSYKKVISVIVGFILLLHPYILYAQDIASSSAQESERTFHHDRHRHSQPTETPEQIFPEIDSPTPANTPIPINTPESSQEASIISPSESPSPIVSPSDTPDQTSNSQTQTTSQNKNDAEIQKTVDTEAVTGQNSTENNIISQTTTGDATNSADVITLANNNTKGSDIHQDVVNIPHDNTGDIDLSNVPQCSSMSEAGKNDFQGLNTNDSQNRTDEIKKIYTEIYNSNKAKVINNITLLAVTGQNNSSDTVNTIQTGDATATANIANIVNTNLAGNCGYFGVINVFGNQTGDIILPSELQYLGSNYATESSSTETVNNTNNATVDNNIQADVNTGSNSADGAHIVQTGTATTNIRLADTTNTNIEGDRWALVYVNYYGDWNGSTENWQGNFQKGPHSALLWVRLPEQTTAQSSSENQTQKSDTNTNSDTSVNNSNDATVQNNVRVVADSGNNTARGRWSDIRTGNATATVNEATIANTNIIGNNWFFGIINIFGNFIGNLVFARPDVSISQTVNKTEALPGDDIVYTISFTNQGKDTAENVVVEDALPSNALLRSYSSGGTVNNNTIRWSIGNLQKGQSGTLTVIVTIENTDSNIQNSVRISTSSQDENTSNNNSTIVTNIRNIGGTNEVINYVQEVTPTPIYNYSYRYYVPYSPAGQNSTIPVAKVISKTPIDDGAEWREEGKILASADQIKRREGMNICTKNIYMCSGMAGFVALHGIYFFIKQKGSESLNLFSSIEKSA